jgi:hypothetical protein
MPVSAPLHLRSQRSVPLVDGTRLHTIIAYETINTATAPQVPNKHVQLYMLAKQVLTAHYPWIYHPHSHRKPFANSDIQATA